MIDTIGPQKLVAQRTALDIRNWRVEAREIIVLIAPAAETRQQAYFYVFPGLGHGAAGVAACPNKIFIHFLKEPLAEPPDVCFEAMP